MTIPEAIAPDLSIAPPVSSFSSFLTLFDGLHAHWEKYGALPERVDRHFWEKLYHAGVGFSVNSGLKRLGVLHSGTNAITKRLEDLAMPETRKATLHLVLQDTYSDILPLLAQPHVPRTQINEEFARVMHVQGTQARRGVGFLIPAAEFAGFPVSAHLLERSETLRRRFAGARMRESVSTSNTSTKGKEVQTSSLHNHGVHNGAVPFDAMEAPSVGATLQSLPVPESQHDTMSDEARALISVWKKLARQMPNEEWQDELAQRDWLRRLDSFYISAQHLAQTLTIRRMNEENRH